ncbi:hypothetical protein BD311DRAFT_456989 [Dichomitus squalens]|uniref:Uncharacterized protein n=1 Tax=Dichomitus squalens TaxID=114155 RepID=A0A4Q9MJK1_9APHY|nr:hypothetical protein BD311DRAFT_456989 [Dichomitus squalens]
MRLLHNKTGQFVEFPDYQRAQPYAILSHTWNPKGEQTYQQLRKIQRRYGPDGSLRVAPNAVAVSSTAMPSSATIDITQRSFPAASRESEGGNLPAFWNDPRLSDKVRGACAIARANGYDLIWIDSCCIDKTSSAELSEAINSMYLWYNASAVCYVFLVDVPPGDSVEAMDSHFRASRWFKRGWTLQELLAPRNVQFLDSDWRLLGSKASLAQVVQECTRIDVEVLTHIRPLDRVSVARRMSWAANRETSRIEDRAYSLMGMFDIRMPTLYGEGQGAFRRLQEEILRRIPDQSLFAWTSGESIGVLPYVRHGSITFLADTISLSSVVRQDPERTGKPGVSLFASSPSEFGASHCISPLSPSSSVLSRSYPPFDYVQMPYGMRAQFLMIPADRLPSHRYYFLVLACQHVRRAEQLVIQLCYLGPRLHSGGPRRLSLPKLASARGGLLTMQASTFLATKVRVKTVYIPHYSSSGMPSLPRNPFASLESYPQRFWSVSATFSLSLAPRARAALQSQRYSVEIADRHDPGVWILLLSRNEQTLRIAFHAAPSDPPFLKSTAIASDDGSGRSTHSLLAVLEPDPNHSHEFSTAMRFRRLVLRTATGALWDLEVWSESKKVLFRPAHHLLVV